MKTYILKEQNLDELIKLLIDKADEQMQELTTTDDQNGEEACYSLDKEQKEKAVAWVKDAFYEACLKDGTVVS
jgi:dTDP-D-glucose 4,6-dehydratase